MGLFDLLFNRNARQAARLAPSAMSGRVDGSDCPAASSRSTDPCSEGDLLLARGLPEQALDAYQEAIERADTCVAGHCGQGRAYAALGRLEDACDSLEVALALDAHCLPALQLLARLLREGGRASESIPLLQRALRLAPQKSELHFELALALNRAGQVEAAMQAYRDASACDPSDPGPLNNLGLIHLHQFGDPRTAEECFRRVLEIAPGHDAGMLNLGLAAFDQGRYRDALELYREGLRRHPGHVELRWHEALALLALGEYEPGWSGYETRFARAISRKLDAFPYPDWDGRQVEDGALLVLAEQGLGDEIMFASCLPDLRPRAGRVVLECAPRLEKLFARSFPWIDVHGQPRDAATDWLQELPRVTAKTAIGSLPRFVRGSRDAFPLHDGYLVPDSRRAEAYRERLRALDGTLKVGISWRGGTRVTRGVLRSIQLDELQPLLAVPDVRFVSVQHALDEGERQQACAAGITLWEEAMSDLDEAAALFAALDVVITVANTNAHLAGALGLPAWVLLSESPDWRWLRAGERSPWYPSMLLFRAEGTPRWTSTVARLAQRLAAAVADRSLVRCAAGARRA